MSPLLAAQITAIGTAILAFFAVVAAVFAYLAFRKQSAEVTTLQHQARDQSEQLGLQRRQFEDQQKANARQAEVLDLQARELRESLTRLEREESERRRAQAARVFFWDERTAPNRARISVIGGDEPTARRGPEHRVHVAHVRNDSEFPISDLEFRWHLGSAAIGQPDHLLQLLPGSEETRSQPVDPGDGDPAEGLLRFEAVLVFRDFAGVKWLRKPDGELMEWQG
jgi:hypothetical protein